MRQETDVAIKVWDLPVRLFHWALVLLFVFQLVSGKIGGDLMAWHAYSGYCVLVLVIFRILWGFAGNTYARFASFLAGPKATLRYASRLWSREPVPHVGHNPLGGWMVIAMVASLALQATSGLFANDGLAFEGPPAALVTLDVSNILAQVHRWNLKVLLVLAGLHIAAVLFHWFVKRDNLTRAMFTGVKRFPEAAVPERSAPAPFAGKWRALALLMVAVASVYVVVRGPH